MKAIIKSVVLITVFSLLVRVSGFIFRIYLSWTIGAEGLGIYQIAFSVFIVLITAVSSGLPLIVSKLTARNIALKDTKSQKSMVTTSLIVGATTSLLLCAIILLFNQYLNLLFTDTRCLFVLITLLPAVVFTSVYSVFRGVLWGQNKYFSVCVVELFEQIARIVICVIGLTFLFSTVDGSIIASISLSIACLLSMLLVAFLYFKYGNKLSKPTKIYNEVIKTSIPITLIRVASSLIQPFIAIVVPIQMIRAGYTAEQSLSLFGSAIGMSFPLLFLPSTIIGSLAMTLIPDLASATAQNRTNYINDRIKNCIMFSFLVSFLFVPVFASLGVPICELLFGDTMAGNFLSASAWIMVPLSMTTITTSILNSLGLELKAFKYSIFGSIFLLLSVIFLPAYIGINSIIIGMGGCTAITMFLNLSMIARYTKTNITFTKTVLYLTLILIPTIIFTNSIFSLSMLIFPSIVTLILCSIICVGVYILLCEIFGLIRVRSFIVNNFAKHRI